MERGDGEDDIDSFIHMEKMGLRVNMGKPKVVVSAANLDLFKVLLSSFHVVYVAPVRVA